VMDKKGRYSKDTVYGEVMRQLRHWYELEHGDQPKPKRKKKKSKKSKAKTDKATTP